MVYNICLTLTLYLLALIRISSSTNCRKEMYYDDTYGYGYNIYCSNITDANLQELKEIEVYKEILMTIDYANISSPTKEIFAQIPKLKFLIITNSSINLKPEFKNQSKSIFNELQLLEKLTMKNCHLTKIENNYFPNNTKINTLDLSNNAINKIEENAFNGFKNNLLTLKLPYNNLQSLTNIPLLNSLTNLQELNLNWNKISFNSDVKINLTTLKRLYLSGNNLHNIENAFCNLTSLKVFDLSFNKIRSLNKVFVKNAQLEIINLEGNKIERIGAKDFEKMSRLKEVNLKDNLLLEIHTSAFFGTTDLSKLTLANNYLHSIYFNNHTVSLQELNLANNSIEFNTLLFQNILRISKLNLQKNNIKLIPANAFQNIKSLQYLDLSFNSRELKIDDKAFAELTNLRELNLRNNNIKRIGKDTFVDLQDLRVLDISDNGIKLLDNSTFANLRKLEVLNMSRNSFVTVDSSLITPMYSLKELDFASNKLQKIDYEAILEDVPNLHMFNIKGNELSCPFLTKMIRFFKLKKMEFTINEAFSYDKENVEGIYCNEVEKEVEQERIKDKENLRILNEIAAGNHAFYEDKMNETILICAVIISISLTIAIFVGYKGYLLYRSRSYLSDELELIDREKM